MMDLVKARTLIKSTEILAPVMNDDEISDIAKVLIRVTNRLLKENKGGK